LGLQEAALSVKKRLKIYFKIGAIFYLVLLALLTIVQRRLIYFPTQKTEAEALQEARFAKAEPWRDAEGQLVGWRSIGSAHRQAANRLIVFHGNAGAALDRTYYVDGFEQLDDGRLWQVHLFEYPGYGARAGKPGEKEFTKAAREGIAQLLREDARPIYVLGESIGSGPACALARDEASTIAGVYLVTPFARLVDVAARHFPFVPVRLIVRDRWDNVRALQGYRGALAVMIAGQDEVVTPAQGELLFDGYAGPKRRWFDPEGTHNLIDFGRDAPWWREVSDFLLEKRL
jgi:uncharacterized protein